ncbi:hypothetical protein BKA56DRAFT_665569 [Ilyonectria sp. MPI-CAGE-AT-0026]|nr:hypothetical protein BKA56DRAFT_665569 [Ilyonectria sp. MPI-CAGE-AT-0026]
MTPTGFRLVAWTFLTLSCLSLFVAARPHQSHHALHSHFLASLQKRANGVTTILFNATTLTDTSLSHACIDALAAPLGCSGYILDEDMLYTWGGFSDENLVALCTTNCSKSIEIYRSNVIIACANDVYTDPVINSTEYIDGTNTREDIYNVGSVSVQPIALADYYFLNYRLLCLKDDESERFCYSETGNGKNTTLSDCSSCNLDAMRLQLEDARTFDEELVEEYSSVASSCKVTAAPITTPSPVTGTDQSTSTKTCQGSSMIVPTSVSCDDFAFAHNISTSQLLSRNHLSGGCADWPGDSSELCIEGSCEPYVVQKDDTCGRVARAHNITLTQLLRWNYFIDPYCNNWDQQIGHVICVTDPSGYTPPKVSVPSIVDGTATTAAPVPSDAQPESTKDCGKWYEPPKDQGCAELTNINGITFDDFRFLNPQIDANCTNMWAETSYCIMAVGDINTYANYSGTAVIPTATSVTSINLDDMPEATYTPSAISPVSTGYPFANDSVQACYHNFNNDNGEVSCSIVAAALGVSVYDWVKWNPSVLGGADSYSPGNCTLKNETQYCGVFYDPSSVESETTDIYVPKPTDATANATTSCEDWYTVSEGETCEELLEEVDIPLWALHDWNPSVGSKCEKLMVDASYCVRGPGWETVSYDATQSPTQISSSTVTGTIIETTSTAKNSAASTSRNTAKTSVKTTQQTASKTSSGPPGPTQSGITKNCQKWYLAQKDDGCQAIADKFKITLSDFYSWNPAVGTDCKNLWVDEAYCVSVSGQ